MTEELQQALAELLRMLQEEVVARFLPALSNLIAALVIFALGIYLAGLASRAVRSALLRRKSSTQAVLMLTKIARWTVFILGLTAALQQLNFNLTAFLTGLGIVGFTIGFALQDVSKNFVSGIILLIQQPFQPGDVIEVRGYAGVVMAVDLRTTDIRTWDGRVVILPNADVITNPIINYSRAPHQRIEISAGVEKGSDLTVISEAAKNAVLQIPGVLADPSPQVVFQANHENLIDFKLYYWVNTRLMDITLAKDAGLARVQAALDDGGIRLPTPIQSLISTNGSR